MDRQPRRFAFRFELTAAGNRGSLCTKRLEGEVRERLRGGVEQGHEPGPLRSRRGREKSELEQRLFRGGAPVRPWPFLISRKRWILQLPYARSQCPLFFPDSQYGDPLPARRNPPTYPA